MFKKYKEKFIGDREFYANLIRLIIPMIVQQGITSFVSLLDNVMVGRLGTESMSGVAIVNQLLFVFNLTIFGGLAGASIFGAQFYGKGDHKGVRYALRFKLIFSVLMAVIAIVALLFFNNPLISLFLTESESGGDLVLTLSEAKNYLFVMLIGLIPFSFSQSYSSTLRETGETVSPMTASIIAIVTNFVLNYILIFGSFGAPRLGVVGAAIATVIARYIEAIYLIIHTHRREKTFIFAQGLYKSLYLPGAVVKKILLTGTPLMLNELFWSIGTTMISQSYSTRGLTVVAATNIAGTVWNLFCVIMFAMATPFPLSSASSSARVRLKKQSARIISFCSLPPCCTSALARSSPSPRRLSRSFTTPRRRYSASQPSFCSSPAQHCPFRHLRMSRTSPFAPAAKRSSRFCLTAYLLGSSRCPSRFSAAATQRCPSSASTRSCSLQISSRSSSAPSCCARAFGRTMWFPTLTDPT